MIHRTLVIVFNSPFHQPTQRVFEKTRFRSVFDLSLKVARTQSPFGSLGHRICRRCKAVSLGRLVSLLAQS